MYHAPIKMASDCLLQLHERMSEDAAMNDTRKEGGHVFFTTCSSSKVIPVDKKERDVTLL